MAMTGAGAPSNHSPNLTVVGTGGVGSSAWSHVVAAAAAAPPTQPLVEAPAVSVNSVPPEEPGREGFDNGGNNGAGGAGRRPAWSKPSSGGGGSSSSEVMDADSWPALVESARATAKSPALSETAAKGPVPELQNTGSSVPSSPQRQVKDNAGMSNAVPTHQRTFRRNNSNTSSNGGHPQQHSGPQGSVTASGPQHHGSRTGFGSSDHPQQRNDHPQRNSFRNRNGGPHPRGDGAHHHNYGGRRDQGHGHQDWNAHRNFNGRDNYMSPRFGPRMVQAPPPPPPNHFYAAPPQMRPFGGMGYSEPPLQQMVYMPSPHLDSLRGVSYIPPIPPNLMYYQPPDPHLYTKIVNQIDYYFSNDNLIKDLYLRQNMDDQGWVPISLIAGFKKVMQLTDNIQVVLDAVRTSSVLEVNGDKIRRRNDWARWLIPPNIMSSQTVGRLAEQIQGIALESTNNDSAQGLDALQNRPFGELNSQLLPSTSDGGQAGIQVSNHSISAQN
ncbi:hypothetical protein HN51_000827 [Arachis hypogaea]|uniref:La-related protein 1B n=2 Tax=Arachis TaxID=3817 RepID=A0A6P4CIK6_ARADU|nr:la-related protein 1B [Arachis duranensis]XP_025695284.1 la-related protein 1B [Arachis hypogaea]XP_052109941.1 la-related protein 1B [Arachis duranensis]QHO48818.1 La-related protein 1C [Arachis hypogaea]RYR79059.1 hypothetical protein Ahy_A01g003927 [Arachis hypogaea]